MSGEKKYCITCKHEGERVKDGAGGYEIKCNYKNRWINDSDRQTEWCSDWVFKHDDSNRSSNSRSFPNPLERIISGIGYGFLIIFQVIALPVLLLTFLRHPILSVAKAIRVVISAIALGLMIAIAIYFDPLMLIIWIISFGFIKTSKLVVIGYTESLYEWITSYGGFWDLD